jgi:hypothetical protein
MDETSSTEIFLETKALLMALEVNESALLAIIEQLLPGERRALRGACALVRNAIDRVNDREYNEKEKP